MKIFRLSVLSLSVFSMIHWCAPATSEALPPPPPLKKLCRESSVIVSGHYTGGMVGEVKDCQFWVTFRVKADKYYKQPGNLENIKEIQFKKRYFEDTKECSRLPGPNAMPGVMKEELFEPKKDKKIFFFKEAHGALQSLANIFWGITDWNTAAPAWHKEFKETPDCHS